MTILDGDGKMGEIKRDSNEQFMRRNRWLLEISEMNGNGIQTFIDS